MSRLQRIRDRKLVQWVVAYCAGAWTILQVLEFLTGQFNWTSYFVRALTLVLGIGIAAIIVIAWFHGERGAQRVSTLEGSLLGMIVLVAVIGAVSVRKDPADRRPAADMEQGSVAVLPFRNLSGDTTQKFFSDGFTEELSNALANIEGVRVYAPSAFAFGGDEESIRRLAREFKAGSMLEGSVRRSGQQVRITAFLVDTRSNRRVWSSTYDKTLSPANILAVQAEIAGAIARSLQLALLPQQAEKLLLTGGTNNQQAYDAYLRGLGALSPVTRESNAIAAREFERAIALDPVFARAHAGLAFALAGYWGPRADDPNRQQILKRAERAARRALQLDSSLADPHVVLQRFLDPSDKAAREAHLETAIRNEPAARWPRLFRAYLEVQSEECLRGTRGCDRQRAVAEMDRLLALDPTSPWSYIMAANIRNLAGEYARADTALNRAEQLGAMGFGPYPKWPLYWNRAYTAVMWRQYERAGSAIAKAYAPEFASTGTTSSRVLREVAAIMRTTQDTVAQRRRALEVVHANEARMQAQFAGMLYMQFGDTAKLFDLMSRKPGEVFATTPVYDPIRNTPRFQQNSARPSPRSSR